MDNYEVMELIGNGSYGFVYKAKKITAKEETYVALKKIKYCKKTCIENEVTFLKKLKHDNIIKYEDYIYEGGCSLYLIFELMDTDLRTFINKNYLNPINANTIKQFFFQIIKAIHFCHTKLIIHRDLKPENILIKNDSIVKVADFGLAMSLKNKNNRFAIDVGTIPYRAPEMSLKKRPYGSHVDIWSTGCIFAELMTRRVLFKGLTVHEHLTNIFSILGSPTGNSWPKFTNLPGYLKVYSSYKEPTLNAVIPNLDYHSNDLLKKIFTFNPDRRITAIEILNHKYFNNVDIQN